MTPFSPYRRHALAALAVLALAGCATTGRVLSKAAISLTRPGKYFDRPELVSLCDAISSGALDRIRNLVAAGADVNAVGKEGMTPLHWAIMKQEYEAFSLLLDLGAKPDRLVIWFEDGVAERWASAMELAALLDDPRYLRRLLAAGAGADTPVSPLGATALFVASAHRRFQNVDILLGAGANIDFRSKRVAETPMHDAMYDGNYVSALYLIRKGAEADIAAETGRTAMDVFAQRGPPSDPSDKENRKAYEEIVALQAAGKLPIGKR